MNMVNEAIFEIERAFYPKNVQACDKSVLSLPTRLYVRGAIPTEECKYLCVIGSRTWTPYGRDVTQRILKGLRGYPICIVSGLATGIDSIAHETALEVGLTCLGFPGTGLSWVNSGSYARMNLEKKIIQSGGGIVSMWHPDHPAAKWTYPVRNKLMAAFSDAVLIIEGGENSGTMSTAQAMDSLNRDIYVVPGSIYSRLSEAPHELLRSRSAKIVTSSEDLLNNLGLQISETRVLDPRNFDTLDELSRRIVTALSLGEITVDALADKLGAGHIELQIKLSELELNGFIKIDRGSLKLV